MPVPAELKPFFLGLVEKSKKGEVNWQSHDGPTSFRVIFPDMEIRVWQEGEKSVQVALLNERQIAAADITVEYGDDEWLGAVALINSASRTVTRIDVTIRRAMELLAQDGTIGDEPENG